LTLTNAEFSISRPAARAAAASADQSRGPAGPRSRRQDPLTDKLMVEAVDVCKRFRGRLVLDTVNLKVSLGEVVCIVGPSGAGKTTFLRCINWLERIDSGAIYVDGRLMGCQRDNRDPSVARELSDRKLASRRAEIGMVFQRFNLFPHMTVMQNLIEAPIRVKREPRDVAITRARELLASVGLADREKSYPNDLSGGEQQRVAIVRALNMQPKIMLFDEPTSALDPELVSDVLDAMRDLARGQKTMIIVTHHIEFAQEVADTLVFMDGGRIVEIGNPTEVLRNPANDRTRAFLSACLGSGGD
jgi:polar amino acid transport system ATP-binding protein